MRLAICLLTAVLVAAAAVSGCDRRPKDDIPAKIEPAPKFEPKADGDKGRSADW